MAFQIIVNLIVSFIWMFLSESYTFISFISGYILGAILLLLFNRLVPGRFYLIGVYKIFILILIFIRELISSNIDIVKLVYKRHPEFEPGIFVMPTELKSNWEITLLANLITLTPGTLSVAISDDNSNVYIHAINIDKMEDSVQAIKHTFEKAIMEVTR